MNLEFKTREKTSSIILGLASLIGFQIFYFTLVINPQKISDPSIFWLSFFAWGSLGFVMFLRNVEGKRKAQDAFLVFAAVLTISLVLTSFNGALASTTFSFPGFSLGIALNGLIILGRRALHSAE